MRRYSPGVVAGVGLYIPLAGFGSFNLLQQKLIPWVVVLGCFGIGSFSHYQVFWLRHHRGRAKMTVSQSQPGSRPLNFPNCRCAIADPGKFL
jgi:hypothetical protein